MNHQLRCRCGTVRGQVVRPGVASRARCYCKDCRAFANFLGQADAVLDADGGTGIVATLPRALRFGQGTDALRCMSLSGRGLLRWYAGCCNTPIGNTPRDPRMPYVGLVEACLQSDVPSLESSFGPVRVILHTKSATRPVASAPVRTLVAIAEVMAAVIGARLRGATRENPFFDPTTRAPIAPPRVLTPAERAHATDGHA